MTPIQLRVFGILFLGVVIIIIMIITRKKVLSFLYPDKYILVEMLELDNSINSWIQEKNPDLRFEFNKGYYHLYHQGMNEKGDKIGNPAIYRDGRLAKFFYQEGNCDPIDFRQGKITGNPQITMQIEKTNITDLFEEEENFLETFIRKWGIVIVIGILIILAIAMMSKKPDAAVQVVKGG
jgi:hypothetical protein